MHRRADDRADVEAAYAPLQLPASVLLRQRHVEVRLGRIVSNGPGVSIDANVVARMNGGVSSRIGCTSDGIVTIFFVANETISP
jgi:hypothetical protein